VFAACAGPTAASGETQAVPVDVRAPTSAVPTSETAAATDAPGGSVSMTLAGQFGNGRALYVHPTDRGLVVVTTAGVGVLEETGVDMIDTFAPGARVGASALSPDGSELAVWTASPSTISWYDVHDRRRIATAALPVEGFVAGLAFGLGEGRATIAVTPEAILRWPEPADAAPDTLFEGAPAAGAGALVPGLGFVVALAGTSDLAVIDDTTEQRISLDAPNLRDVDASRDGRRIGVVTTEDADDPVGADAILVVDTTTFDVVGEYTSERRLSPRSWTLNGSGVVVTDGVITTFDRLDGSEPIRLPTVGDDSVAEVQATESVLVGIGRSGPLYLWSVDGSEGELVGAGTTGLLDAVIDDGEDTLTTVDAYGRIQVWDLASNALVADDDSFEVGEATAIAVGSNGDSIGVASSTGRVALLDNEFALTGTVQVADEPLTIDALAFEPATGQVVTGLAHRLRDLAFDDTVTVWDGGEPRFSVGGESEDVGGCAFFYSRLRFSPDGRLLAATSHDFSVAVIDLSTGELVGEIPPGPAAILDIAFTPDGAGLVVTDDVARVHVWNLDDESTRAEYQAPMGGYQAIRMLPGEPATMATVDITGALRIVEVDTGATLATLEGTSARTTRIATSTDGGLLAAPVGLSAVGVWSTVTGAMLSQVEAHHATLTDLEFTADGSALLTASRDGTVRRWDLAGTR